MVGVRVFAAPVIVAAALRLALLAATLSRTGTSVITSGDTASYLEPGRNLLLHGRFFTGVLPEIDRTPGYPLFLAVASLPGSPQPLVAQVILSAFTVVLVWRLARAVFEDDRIALTAAWLFAFEPVSIIYSVRLMPETLYLALLLLSLERMVVFLRGRSLRMLARRVCGWRRQPLCARSATICRLRWRWVCLLCWRAFPAFAGRLPPCCC